MSFNLSEWALKNRQIVLFFMIVTILLGVNSYRQLGQSEDPPFTFKAMVVRTFWPGATPMEVSRFVTEPIQRTLMQTGAYERVMAYSIPGESQVFFVAKDSMLSKELPELWYQVRKKISDIRYRLPSEIQGPFFNDEFGTTYGNIYALTGDAPYNTLKDFADRLQLIFQRVPNVGKVELIGVQDERIWIELSNAKAAMLGISLGAIQQAIDQQNRMISDGFYETQDERIYVRVSGSFNSVESVENVPLRVNDRTMFIKDVADVRRGMNEPMAPNMRFEGKNAIGIAVSMLPGGDILVLGEQLQSVLKQQQQELPLGMNLHVVSSQPEVVANSVGEFIQVLLEAIIIVLGVSFFSLGMRSGLVVALAIPLVLAMTFTVMHYFGIGLHKISLGALVLALGLLVDDAIIAVEMMSIKMEQGFSRIKAASFAWQSTAFPMLTGTLITAAGFLPIATANSSTGEYTRSIFQVVTIALLASWLVAVLFVPLLGEKFLPSKKSDHHSDLYQGIWYQRFRKMVESCLKHRQAVIFLTLALFLVTLTMFKLVPQQFFPASGRLELLVDLKLTEGASLTATQAHVDQLEKILKKESGIESFVSYVGTGSPRFYLPLDQQMPSASFAQVVIATKSIEDRERIRLKLIQSLPDTFPDTRTRVARLENGPPVGYPIQYRVSGEHLSELRIYARQVADQIQQNPNVVNVHMNWEEPSKVIKILIDQDRARALGVSTQSVTSTIQAYLVGIKLGDYREKDNLIELVLRGNHEDRQSVEQLSSLNIQNNQGKSVPIMQVARIQESFEEGIIWERNALPTITVRADIYNNTLPATVVNDLAQKMKEIEERLPSGYLLEVGGTVEDSARGQSSVNAGMPLFLMVVFTLLMFQLRSLSRASLVILTAPLGLIGVVIFLLIFDKPFGFVAMLGTIALAGMIMRNTLILVDQIEQDIKAGMLPWDAVIESTVRRARPIVLTALAAVLAMIPLSASIFFGPMAVAIMGGLVIATLLTLLFVPALYVTWYKVHPSQNTNN